MTLQKKLNEYVSSKYYVLQYMYEHTGYNEDTSAFAYRLNDIIANFIDYINIDLLNKLNLLYTLIWSEWGLNPNDFVLTA